MSVLQSVLQGDQGTMLTRDTILRSCSISSRNINGGVLFDSLMLGNNFLAWESAVDQSMSHTTEYSTLFLLPKPGKWAHYGILATSRSRFENPPSEFDLDWQSDLERLDERKAKSNPSRCLDEEVAAH